MGLRLMVISCLGHSLQFMIDFIFGGRLEKENSQLFLSIYYFYDF